MNRHSKTIRSNTLRIIGGQWRGRKLKFPDIEGLRPTGDCIRETLFNWLSPYLEDAHCLDLFAGSGALGFEALSRGARQVTFIDKHPAVIQQLKIHAEQLQTKASTILQYSATDWLQTTPTSDKPFDIIFLDPPFSGEFWNKTIESLVSFQWLAPQGWVYIETPNGITLSIPSAWQLHRQKTSGEVDYSLYQVIKPS